MFSHIVVGFVCLIVGGYGGYEWGRAAEAKAQAILAAGKQAAQTIGAAVKK